MPKRKLTNGDLTVLALDVIEALAAAEGSCLPADELCRRYSIDHQDLDRLIGIIGSLADRETGARSVCYENAEGMVVLENESETMLPLRLTSAEGAVLDRELEGLGLEEAAAERIRKALLPRELGYSHHVETAVARGAFWRPLHEAVEDGVRIRMGYRSLAEDVPGARTVDPMRIFREDGALYLAAWDVEKHAARIYRLDRITSVELTEDSVELHAGGTVSVRTSLGQAGRAVRLSMPSKRAQELGWPCIDRVDIGGTMATVTVRVASKRWLFSQILAAAGEIVILDDPALALELKSFAVELLDRL